MKAGWNSEFFETMRQSSDVLADKAIRALKENQNKHLVPQLMQLDLNSDPWPDGLPREVEELIREATHVPQWVNDAFLAKTESFWSTYLIYIYTSLLFASLPYCYAAADGARVLGASGRIREFTEKRLSETGQFIQDVLEPGAFSPQGKALKSIVKVRLIHAAVRQGLLASGKWQKEWGVPTNMEDMAGTNLAFSVVTLRSMEKMGVELSKEEKDLFVKRWDLVSGLLGMDHRLMSGSFNEAIQLEKWIVKRLFRPSDQGKELTASLLEYIGLVEKPAIAPGYGSDMMRFLLGDMIGDVIGLKEKGFFSWPGIMSSINALVHRMGWSPEVEQHLVPLHLTLIKRGKVVNQRMEYPLFELMKF